MDTLGLIKRFFKSTPVVDYQEGLLKTILNSSIDAIISIDENSSILEWNKAAELMFGYAREEVLGKDLSRLIIPIDYRAQHRVGMKRWLLNKPASRVINQRIELYAINREGGEFPVELTVVASNTDRGHIFTATIRDITQSKKEKEQLKLLSGEQKHRIKNIMSVVQSIAQRSFKGTPPETVAPFLSRIFAMSKAYDILFAEDFKNANLKDIVQTSIYIYEKDNDNFRIYGVPFDIPANSAVSFSLVINELCTNSVKYGALSVPDGYVEITWAKMSDKLLWAWQEFNGPEVEPNPKKGFGYNLITRAFTGEGETVIEFNPKGLKCTLSLVFDH